MRGTSFERGARRRRAATKRLTTRLYIGAWVVGLVALAAMLGLAHLARPGSAVPPAGVVAETVFAGAATVMVVIWIRTLFELAVEGAWGWFAAVLVLNLVGLGIVGMVGYAVAGPQGPTMVVTRPSTTA